MYRLPLFILLLLFVQFASAQPFTIDSTCQTISSTGDNIFPDWPEDGSRLLFQSNRNGNWDIYLFDFDKDTIIQLTFDQANEQHPVWFPGENRIVFDSDREGKQFLYKMDLKTGEISFLFKRKIECRQASFSTSKRLVYFSGFDNLTKNWAIYSYDFISDNLNDLTNLKGNCTRPVVSPNGKKILFQRTINTYPFVQLLALNWYGNLDGGMDFIGATDPCWSPNALKIYFISKKEEMQGEVYSIWKDHSHLLRLTNDKLKVRTPAVSPDGRKMALSVKQEKGYELFIIPLEAY